ncbi:MAG: hypothetical protein KF723_06520 [Rhizobiaceae bacterium]|nr:hypothetical protein [Rhizobiaceae bacterium]
MRPDRHRGILLAKLALALTAFAAATGAAFAAWIDHGPAMLMSMAASTMAWCF